MPRSRNTNALIASLAPALIAPLVAPLASAAPSVTVPLTGVSITTGATNTKSSSPATIDPALRFRYVIDGNVRGTPPFSLLGLLYSQPTPLASIITTFGGSPEDLSGVLGNASGTFPSGPTTVVFKQNGLIGTTPASIQFNLTGSFSAAGVVTFTIDAITITPTLAGGLVFTSGQVTISTITCLADLNFDNLVDDSDFILFVPAYNDLIVPQPQTSGDFNGDGQCDDADFQIFAAAYNELVCP
ncbi:MAG: hypothetical protein U0570_04220 [Phycisphaerales bacterium]